MYRYLRGIKLEDFSDEYRDEAHCLYVLSQIVPNPPKGWDRLETEEAIFETRKGSMFRFLGAVTLEDFSVRYRDEAYFLFVLSQIVPNPPKSRDRVDTEAIFWNEDTRDLVEDKLTELMPRDDIVIQLYESGLEGGFDRFGFDSLDELFQLITSTDESSCDEFAYVAAEKWGLIVDYEGVEIYPSKFDYSDEKELRELRFNDCRWFMGLWQSNVFKFATRGSGKS